MKTPHKHAELIKAWADGAEIEFLIDGDWFNSPSPAWNECLEYRALISNWIRNGCLKVKHQGN